jgi:hypothetical protein
VCRLVSFGRRLERSHSQLTVLAAAGDHFLVQHITIGRRGRRCYCCCSVSRDPISTTQSSSCTESPLCTSQSTGGCASIVKTSCSNQKIPAPRGGPLCDRPPSQRASAEVGLRLGAWCNAQDPAHPAVSLLAASRRRHGTRTRSQLRPPVEGKVVASSTRRAGSDVTLKDSCLILCVVLPQTFSSSRAGRHPPCKSSWEGAANSSACAHLRRS